MALFAPATAHDFKTLTFRGCDFPRELFPPGYWGDLSADAIAQNAWGHALATLLAEVSAGRVIIVAQTLRRGMKWNAPPNGRYPQGALVGSSGPFKAAIPLLKHLSDQCSSNSGATGPAATKLGVSSLKDSWSVEVARLAAEVRSER